MHQEMAIQGTFTQYHRATRGPASRGETFTGQACVAAPGCLSRVEPRSTTPHGLCTPESLWHTSVWRAGFPFLSSLTVVDDVHCASVLSSRPY
ncbi:hypothetical protein FJTKL_08062 [Diaporthe vaccinii]|uniref:Uncharacterized protein n=1 Tax=Diaporthe vaccinii TaxID=105482 RepID=A0ABR4FEF0_9PEZI